MPGGWLRVEPPHSATIPLEELDDTMAGLADGSSGWLKILVDPSAWPPLRTEATDDAPSG